MKHVRVRKILPLLFCVAMLFASLLPVSAAAVPQFEYGIADGGIEIFSCERSFSGALVIPATWNGEPVVAVGDSGFSYRQGLTSVVISEGITLINSYAFSGCEGLTSVTLPNSLRQLCYGSFSECSQLAFTVYKNGKYLGNSENPHLALVEPVSEDVHVTVHKNTQVISESFAYLNNVKLSVEAGNKYFSTDDSGVLFDAEKTVLYWAPKQLSGSYTVPAGVLEICGSAFSNSKGLTAITVADSVKSIGSYAFSYLKELKTLNLGAQLEYIGESALYGCDGLTYSQYENGKYLGSAKNPYLLLVDMVDDTATEFVFHKDARVIGPGAFNGCSALTELTVPESIVGIGDSAFWRCDALARLTIGKGVRNIGVTLSYHCPNLTQIVVDSGNAYYSSHNGVLLNKDKTVLLQAPAGITEPYTLPDSVQRIGEDAFFYCDQLTGILFGKGLREIGSNAFYNCRNLTQVTVPGNVEIVKDHAFNECTGLTSVILGEGVKMVERRAFESCSALASVTLPESLTDIGEEAFAAAEKLTEITIPKNVSRIGKDAFGFCGKLTGIHVAEENPCYSSYEGVLYDKTMTCLIQAPGGISQCVVPEGVKTIGENAFFECRKLDLVILPNSVTAIERAAFFDTGMDSILIPASVTEMGESVFSGSSPSVRFLGNAPKVTGDGGAIASSFWGAKVTVYYPADNATWTEEAKQNVCQDANWAASKTYPVTQGADTVITPENVAVTVATEADSFYWIGLFLDGQWVAPENYTLTDDTVITLRADYAAGLKSGVHQLTMAFVDGDADTTLTVQKELVGDLDGINDVDEDDAVYLLQHVLMPEMFPVTENVDFDKNGTVDEDDAVYLLQHVLMPEMFPL